MVADDKAGVQFFDGPGRRKAAFCHGVTAFCHIAMPKARYFGHGGDDAMHVADYIAIGILIACMFGAATMVLSRGKS